MRQVLWEGATPCPPQKEEKRSTQILSIFHYKPKVLFLNRTALHIARNITKLLSYFFFSFFRQTGTCHFIVTTKIQTNKSNTKQDTTQQKSIIQQNTTQRSKAKQSNTKHINATSKHDKINTNINTTSVTFCKQPAGVPPASSHFLKLWYVYLRYICFLSFSGMLV